MRNHMSAQYDFATLHAITSANRHIRNAEAIVRKTDRMSFFD